ncbi:hypothetical protein Kpho01_70890 [Kitasatospora phosalacinea]|uniref:Uncharacterized protein n=1 Tax=Kitasatospora phosalacinea TaxID=2065 RepID=A0A9W6PMD6_9ACTN|nr:hypothetical protein Kpho01_70890 [Kitasatospora phosalacinea]
MGLGADREAAAGGEEGKPVRTVVREVREAVCVHTLSRTALPVAGPESTGGRGGSCGPAAPGGAFGRDVPGTGRRGRCRGAREWISRAPRRTSVRPLSGVRQWVGSREP